MKFFKPKFWEVNRSLFFSMLLFPVSILIQIILYIKSSIAKEHSFSVPIICVGNIYLGGTGKTPLSIKISELLENIKKKPAIIKKKYANQIDEVSLINKKTNNLFTDKSRKNAIEKAIKNSFDVVILDDGFQDYTIKKDMNILCFNERQLAGNEFTIPSGPLRESLTAIKKAKIIFINGKYNKQFEKKIKNISANIIIFYSKYIPSNSKFFNNKHLLAFAGIGNPNNFFNLLSEYNLNVVKEISFPDHYKYSKKDMSHIFNIAKKNNLELITTEKDFHRLKILGYHDINYLSLKLEIENENSFIEELKKCI